MRHLHAEVPNVAGAGDEAQAGGGERAGRRWRRRVGAATVGEGEFGLLINYTNVESAVGIPP